jgi:hypothetical protein
MKTMFDSTSGSVAQTVGTSDQMGKLEQVRDTVTQMYRVQETSQATSQATSDLRKARNQLNLLVDQTIPRICADPQAPVARAEASVKENTTPGMRT